MHKQRLQILIDPEQRRGLDAEADRLGVSLGAVIRESIDARLGGSARQGRIDAVDEMARAARGNAPSLAEVDEILDEARSANAG